MTDDNPFVQKLFEQVKALLMEDKVDEAVGLLMDDKVKLSEKLTVLAAIEAETAALAMARDLADALGSALIVTRDRERDLALALARNRDLAPDLVGFFDDDLANVHDLATELASTLTNAHNRARDLVSTIALGSALYSVYDLAIQYEANPNNTITVALISQMHTVREKLRQKSMINEFDIEAIIGEVGSIIHHAQQDERVKHIEEGKKIVGALEEAAEALNQLEKAHYFTYWRNALNLIERVLDAILDNRRKMGLIPVSPEFETLTLILDGADLTPDVISTQVGPYLEAVFDITRVVAEMHNEPYVEPRIVSIRQGSIEITLLFVGTAATVYAVVMSALTYLQNSREMKRNRKRDELVEEEHKLNREQQSFNLRAVQLSLYVQQDIELDEAERQVRIARIQAEAEEKQIQNEERRLELQRKQLAYNAERIKYAVEVTNDLVNLIGPDDMTQDQRRRYVTEMARAVLVILDSPLTLRMDSMNALPDTNEVEEDQPATSSK